MEGQKLIGLLKYAELEQAAALKYLYGWLRHHPKYGTLAPPELSDSLYYADVSIASSFLWPVCLCLPVSCYPLSQQMLLKLFGEIFEF